MTLFSPKSEQNTDSSAAQEATEKVNTIWESFALAWGNGEKFSSDREPSRLIGESSSEESGAKIRYISWVV